jgi:phage terminase Nu1 subunit (DNA packaging protein)
VDDLIVSQPTLARVFGVSERTVQRWGALGSGAFPGGLDDTRVGAGATYDLPAAVAWRLALEAERLAGENGDAIALDAARARRELAVAALREHELEVRRRELVPREAARELWNEGVTTLVAEIRRLPARFADVVNPDDPAAGEDALERVAEELMRSLHEAFADWQQPEGNHEAA